MIYFTSDPHFDHDAIIKFVGRPFKSCSEMNRKIIKNYSSVVTPEDTLYVVGDFAFTKNRNRLEEILKKIHCNKILILGNHDRFNPFDYVDAGFMSAHTSLNVEEFFLVHDPAVATVVKDKPVICGHVHDLFLTIQKRVINVSVEVWDYKPVSIETIRDTLRLLNM